MNESPQGLISRLFDAERAARDLHSSLVDLDPGALLPALRAAYSEAVKLDDEDEVALRLVRIATVLGELEGDATVDLLIDILDHDDPEARHAAGEALQDLAFDRLKEVALGTERALERLPKGSVALSELPYLYANVGEPSARKLLERFLGHADESAVASAIEALVEMGDAQAVNALRALVDDAREVDLASEDDEEEGGRVRLGELAREAITMLGGRVDDGRPPPRGAAGRPRPRG
ncbi:MAG: HEAT repeat domain-containing protein [Polyangiaceae bacterium]